MFDKRSVAVATLFLSGLQGTSAAANNELRVGVQAGIPNWGIDIDVPLLGQSTSVDPDVNPSFGIVGQFVVRSDEADARGFFTGVEAGFVAETASGSQQLSILGSPVVVDAELAWVTDLVWLAGWDLGNVSAFGSEFGNLSVFGSIGASYASGEVEVELPALNTTGSDSGKHLGWKVGAGVEFDLGASAALQVRANYTDFGGGNYADQGVSLNAEPGVFELKAVLLYKLSAGDLLGFLK